MRTGSRGWPTRYPRSYGSTTGAATTAVGPPRWSTGPTWSTKNAPSATCPPTAWCCPQRLFGGGQIHGDLSPNAFLNVATALDAWTDDPDPADAPHQRSLGARRADALDDLCRASLDPDTRWGCGGDAGAWEDLDQADTFDGFCPTDTLDEHLATKGDVDPHHTHWTGHPTPLPDTRGDPP